MGYDVVSFELQIFDRWGRELFITDDPYKEWDGTAGGKPVPLGVYAYRAKMLDAITKDEHKVSGHVTVVP